MQGTVLRAQSGFFYVKTEAGLLECRLRGRLKKERQESDIAVIGGLIFQGYPGEFKKTRHLQSSAGLLFNVFSEYDPHNLLLRQAYQEVMEQQMEEGRLRDMLERISNSKIVITFPKELTPFCFPLKVDSMREDLSSEKLEDRVRKMQEQLGRG